MAFKNRGSMVWMLWMLWACQPAAPLPNSAAPVPTSLPVQILPEPSPLTPSVSVSPAPSPQASRSLAPSVDDPPASLSLAPSSFYFQRAGDATQFIVHAKTRSGQYLDPLEMDLQWEVLPPERFKVDGNGRVVALGTAGNAILRVSHKSSGLQAEAQLLMSTGGNSGGSSSGGAGTVPHLPQLTPLPPPCTQAAACGLQVLAGTGQAGQSGDNGPALEAELNEPRGLVLDATDRLYLADSLNHQVRLIQLSKGQISTVAGTGSPGQVGEGLNATLAQLDFPSAVATDASGQLFLSDQLNHRLRRVDPELGFLATVAGTGQAGFAGDGGPSVAARLRFPRALAFGPAGDLYFADTLNHRIRKVDAQNGLITTVAGTGSAGFSGDGGLAVNARLHSPSGLTVDAAGHLYIADTQNHRVRKVDALSGLIITLAGTGQPGAARHGAAGLNSPLHEPSALATDGTSLYLADTLNHAVHRLSLSSGTLQTLLTAPLLQAPQGLALDISHARLLIASTLQHQILALPLQ